MKILISIDDVSPHPFSSLKILDTCNYIKEKVSDIKFSLFIPMAYYRTIGETATDCPLYISNYEDFCKKIIGLGSNFELCSHGYYHGIKGVSNNDEFYKIGNDLAVEKFELINYELIKSGLSEKFSSVFRPPGWKISREAIIVAFKYFKILALSPHIQYNYNFKGKEVCLYTCNPPFVPLKTYENIHIVYHACEWDKNFLSIDMANSLIKFIENCENYREVKFSFFKEYMEDS